MGCSSLEHIQLRYCYQVTSVAVIAIARSCANLLHLDIGSCVGVGEEALEALGSGCFNLESIDFLGLRKISDRSFVPFARSHSKLESVVLQGCDLLSDLSVIALSESTKSSLVHLDINSCDDVTDDSLRAIKKNNMNLRSADFTFCRVTDKEILALAAVLPYCRKVGGKAAFKPVHKAVVAYNMNTMYMRRLNEGQTKLAVYIRVFLQKRYFQKMKEWKLGIIVNIQRVMRGKLDRLRVALMKAQNALEQQSAIPIQRFYRSYREHFFAVALVANKRRRLQAAKKIQGAWRVFMAKGCVKRAKLRMYKLGQKFRTLIRKALERESFLARLLATTKLQKWWRYWIEELRLKNRISAACKIQNLFRCIEARRRYDDKLATRLGVWISSAKRIQAGWAVQLHWRSQIAGIRSREAAFKEQYFVRVASAEMIQREWRSYKDVGAARSFIAYKRLQKKCATMIQNCWRFYVAKTAVMRANKYKKWLILCWGTLVHKYVYRYKSKFAARILRMVRYKLWWEARKRSVAAIQRIFRGFLGRCISLKRRYERDSENAAVLIQYIFRSYVKMLRREEEQYRQECAARIQRKFRRHKEWQAYKKLMREVYEQKAKAMQLEKEAMERQRQQALLARLFEKGEGRAARVIQTCYRKYKHKKNLEESERIRNEAKLRDMKEEDERRDRMLARRKHKNSVMGRLQDGIDWAGGKLNLWTSKYDPNGAKLDESDAKKMAKQVMKPSRTGIKRIVMGPGKDEIAVNNEVWDNSILNRQTRSIESEGILGMKITIGSGELFAMNEEQKANALARQPIWKRIDVDLSARKKDTVYLWIMRGIGKSVFTSIELAQPPPDYDNWRVQKSRHAAMEMIGTFIVWHKFLKNLELHCGAAVLAGKSAPPIDFIEITTDEEEWEYWKKKDYVMVEPDMSAHGLGRNVNIWYHTKKFVHEPKMHKVTTDLLGQYNWFDSRLDTVMESYGLRPDTVLELHRQFGKLDYKDNNVADVIEFFDIIGEPRSIYGDWILRACDTDSKNQITFSEFVNIVTVFCMFGYDELLRFTFGMHDEERRSYLDRDQWEKLIIIMMKHENVPHNKKHWNNEYDNFATTIGKKGSGEPEMFYEDFVRLVKTYPMITFPIFRLQDKTRQRFLGEKFWVEQRSMFVEARTRLQVRRK